MSNKRYGYRPSGTPERDKIYPSEIAAQRPALATKVDCGSYSDIDPMASVRGDHGANCYCTECTPPSSPMFQPEEEHEPMESACERMNRQLRDQPLRGERG
jgi:hypothetical protein